MNEIMDLSKSGDVMIIPIDKLRENANHPFEVREDENFMALCESLKRDGLMQPVIVRRMGDEFEILSGHRRTRASKAIGQENIKAIVVEVDDETANRILIDTNFKQREVILPSEIARSYQLRAKDLKN